MVRPDGGDHGTRRLGDRPPGDPGSNRRKGDFLDAESVRFPQAGPGRRADDLAAGRIGMVGGSYMDDPTNSQAAGLRAPGIPLREGTLIHRLLLDLVAADALDGGGRVASHPATGVVAGHDGV